MGKKKQTGKRRTITVHLSVPMHIRLSGICQEKDQTKSGYIKHLLSEAFKREEVQVNP